MVIEGKTRSLIIDTGSNISILQPGNIRDTAMKPFGVTGENLDVKGRQSVSFMLVRRRFHHSFLVCPLPTEAAGLLGTDFLTEWGAIIDLECDTMSFVEDNAAPQANGTTLKERTALTVFTRGKEGDSPQPSPEKVRQKDEQSPAGSFLEKTAIKAEPGWLEPRKISPCHHVADKG